MLAFWNHEEAGIKLETGVDELALALTADTWSRTFRSSAVTISDTDKPVTTRNGIQIVPDRTATDAKITTILPSITSEFPAKALNTALSGIANRYGNRTAAFVAMQLEYAVPSAP